MTQEESEGTKWPTENAHGRDDIPEWVHILAKEIRNGHSPPPDVMTQVRQWLAIFIMLGGIGWLVLLGRQVGHIEMSVYHNTEQLDSHSKDAESAFSGITEILRTIEGRTSRLEGIEEGRNHR